MKTGTKIPDHIKKKKRKAAISYVPDNQIARSSQTSVKADNA